MHDRGGCAEKSPVCRTIGQCVILDAFSRVIKTEALVSTLASAESLRTGNMPHCLVHRRMQCGSHPGASSALLLSSVGP